MTFPLIYCNGDSYSDQNYHSSLNNATYANVVAEQWANAYVFNRAVKGSSNRRIVRTTVHDILHQKSLNPDQPIIALIGLTFLMRSEIWLEDHTASFPGESNFATMAFTSNTTWVSDLLTGNRLNAQIKIPGVDNATLEVNQKYLNRLAEGTGYFYSPYAKQIELLCDLIMLREFLTSQGVKFLIFNTVVPEEFESEYLLDFFQKQLYNDSRFIDLKNFSLIGWCQDQNFKPLDVGNHFGADAHRAFAQHILIPRLREIT